MADLNEAMDGEKADQAARDDTDAPTSNDQPSQREAGRGAAERVVGGEPEQRKGPEKESAEKARQAEKEKQGLLAGLLEAIREFFRRLFGRGAAGPAGERANASKDATKDPGVDPGHDPSDDPSNDPNDPKNDLDRDGAEQGKNQMALSHAEGAVARQSVDHINNRFQGLLAQQAEQMHQNRATVFSTLASLMPQAAQGGQAALEAVREARNVVQGHLVEMETGLNSVQELNSERQNELLLLEGQLEPEALDSFDHATSLADEQNDQLVCGIRSTVQECRSLASGLVELENSLSEGDVIYEHPPLDPDHPGHPQFPARQAALERLHSIMDAAPEGAGDAAGLVQGAKEAVEDLDIPVSHDSLGR